MNHEYPVSEGEKNNIRSSRLYRLSDSIAGLFHHYGLNSPEMIRTWEMKKSYAEGTDFSYMSCNEKWQMRLWDIIFGKESSYLHPGQIIAGILEGRYSLPEIDMKIVIFGSSFLSEQAVEFFHHLSSNCGAEIHHFILSPSPEVIHPETEKSLILSQWGNIVSGLADLLIDKGVDIVEDFAVPQGYSIPEASSMLSSLKNAVFQNKGKCTGNFTSGDSSLRIISVPGKKREIEILKNNIINLIQNEGYSFFDIGVAAPDINSYAPFIDSIFRSDDPALDIRYNLMDVSFIDNSDYLNGFFALLDLTGSRFSRKQLFSLFRNRCFMNCFRLSDSDVDKWLEICDRLFIKWGYDSIHREELVKSRSDFATWKKAFERICCGFLFNEEEPVEFPSGSQILPFSLSGSYEEKTVSSLFDAVSRLYNRIYNLRFEEHEISEWAVRMEMLADYFLSPVYGTRDDNDRKFLKNVFRQINTLVIENRTSESISGKNVPYSLYRILVDEFAGKTGYCRGQYLAEGVSFSSLKPLRAIPFKVLFLLGMDENSFPGREKNRNYDLRSLTPRSIDLSVQNTDCFTFLESILSAEEKLFISYNGTNIITGEILEPSPLVTEIAEMFESQNAPELLTVHPLHGYDQIYFREKDGFRDFISFDRLQYEAASAALDKRKKRASSLSLNTGYSLPDKPEAESDIYRMEKFLKYPVSFFLEHVEEISINETALLENEDTEHFSLSYADEGSINREITGSKADGNGIFSRYIDDARTAGTLNNSSVSGFEYMIMENRYDIFVSNLRENSYFDSSPVDILLSGEKTGSVSSQEICFSPVLIDSGNGTLAVSGSIRGLRRNGSIWYCISYDRTGIRNLVSPFFRYLILRKVTGDNKLAMKVFDSSGQLTAVFEDEKCDVDNILETAAFSYIESFNSPVTADIHCIAELVMKKGEMEDSEVFFNSIDEYYSRKNFKDSRFLNSGTDIVMNYRREDFFRLYNSFYCCLKSGGKEI